MKDSTTDAKRGQAEQAQLLVEVPADLRGSETILIVEDMEAVRRAAARMLCAAGYAVLNAASGVEALELFEQQGDAIQLVLTDVVMPQMSGEELVRRLHRSHPVRVLYMSGYSGEALAHRGLLRAGVLYLPKPFGPDELLEKVRRTLDAA